MAFDPIPSLKGRRAAGHWLRRLSQDRVLRAQQHHSEAVQTIDTALQSSPALRASLKAVLEEAELFGRLRGLREGLQLYELGLRIQGKSPAFRAVVKYVAGCVMDFEESRIAEERRIRTSKLAGQLTSERICEYLDSQVLRIRERGLPKSHISPPDDWECRSWSEALRKKSNNVRVFISEAKEVALSKEYCTLMAWKTWGHKPTRQPSEPNAEAQ